MKDAAQPSPSTSRQRWVGVLPLVFFGLHLGHHIREGDSENMLWACHLANLLIACGLLANRASLTAAGLLWLSIGLPVWGQWLVGSPDEFSVTSALSHVGGAAVGVWAMRRAVWPRGTWWKAWLAFPLLQLLCRFTTPTEYNVNVSQGVWAGGEAMFPSYPVYLALLLGIMAVIFAVVEMLFLQLKFLQPPALPATEEKTED